MKRVSDYIKSKEAHVLINFVFCISLVFTLLYELVLYEIPASSVRIERGGILLSRIFYSTLAASIFYFFSQYIPVVVPKRARKIKILENIHYKTIMIEWYISRLRADLHIVSNEFEEIPKFREIIKAINPEQPINAFSNWYEYLGHLRERIIDATRAITLYGDFLSMNYLHEIIIIEEQLLKPGIFEGIPYIKTGNLAWAELQLQEVLIHNKILQDIREKEFKKYEGIFQKSGQEYRQNNFAKYDAEKQSSNKQKSKNI